MVAFPRGLSRKPIQLVRNTIPPLPLPGAKGCDLGVQGSLQGGPIPIGPLRQGLGHGFSGVDKRKGGNPMDDDAVQNLAHRRVAFGLLVLGNQHVIRLAA